MTILIFPLDALNATQQTIATPGGIPNASYLYIGFQAAPSAGTVLIEGLRPGATTWRTLYNGTAFGASAMCDGGYGPLRVTFAGLTGGSAPSLSIVPAQTVMFPSALYTDGGFGPDARLRVDQGQTGFFAGRMFRFVRKLASPIVYRFTTPVPVILQEQSVTLSTGSVEFFSWPESNVTPSGTWSQVQFAINPANGVNTSYTRQAIMESGGTIAVTNPQNYREYIGIAVSNATAQQQTVGGPALPERQIPAGTYYLQFTGTGTGAYYLSWEERP